MDQEASCQEAGDEVALAQLLNVREEDLLHVIEEKLDDYDFPSAEGEGEGERQKTREQERLWRESLKWEVLDEVRSEVELIKLELLVEVKNEMRRGLAQLVRDSCTNTARSLEEAERRAQPH